MIPKLPDPPFISCPTFNHSQNLSVLAAPQINRKSPRRDERALPNPTSFHIHQKIKYTIPPPSPPPPRDTIIQPFLLSSYLCRQYADRLPPLLLMSNNRLALELLLMIGQEMRDSSGRLLERDFNAFLQVNRALYSNLNPILWQSAAGDASSCVRVFTHLIKVNGLAALERFLSLGAHIEVRLPEFRELGSGLESPSLMVVAAAFDNVPLARLFLKYGAPLVQVKGFHCPRYSAIHAARSGKMVQLLLDHGADPNQRQGRGEYGLKPLHLYVSRGDIAAMRVALQNGADINIMSYVGTPLHQAAEGSVDVVNILLDCGADIYAKDPEGNTALHAAAHAGYSLRVKILLGRWPGAIKVRNHNGWTPLHMAAISGRIDVARLLLEKWPMSKLVIDLHCRTPYTAFHQYGRHKVDESTEQAMRALLG
jgi:hypothetical protein